MSEVSNSSKQWLRGIMRALFMLVAGFLLFQSALPLAHAVSNIVTLKDDSDNIVCYFDDGGNLGLKGTLTPNVSAIVKDGAAKDWYLNAGSSILALVGIEGSSAGTMKLHGAVQTGTPSASHPFALKKSDGTVVASIDTGGNLYLLGSVASITAPTGLTATPVSASQINLSWTKTSTSEAGFKVERSANGTDFWTQITTTTLTSYSNSGLAASTQYYYRVRAYKGVLNSDYSNVADGWSGGPSALMVAVDFANPSGRLNLVWNDNSASETGFIIQRASDAPTSFTQVATLGAHAGTGAMFWSDATGIVPDKTYYYRVIATNAGSNAPSSATNATTADAPIFYESWNAVTGPFAPAAYPTYSSGTTAGSDLAWNWYTLGSNVPNCGFRSGATGYEGGRFATGSGNGAFVFGGSSPAVNLANGDSLSASVDVKVDQTGTDDGREYRFEFGNETDYSGGGTRVVLTLDGNTSKSAVRIQSYDHGVASNVISASSGLGACVGSGNYTVAATFDPGTTGTQVNYELQDRNNPGLPLLSGSGTLNQQPARDLNQVKLTFQPKAVGAMDNVRLYSDSSYESSQSPKTSAPDTELISNLNSGRQSSSPSPLNMTQSDAPLAAVTPEFQYFALGEGDQGDHTVTFTANWYEGPPTTVYSWSPGPPLSVNGPTNGQTLTVKTPKGLGYYPISWCYYNDVESIYGTAKILVAQPGVPPALELDGLTCDDV